ncbi:hypothetical protein IDJ77_16385 [Mucilaginibacter sp. ZT4R22]|uniref:Uncharacterized protein n=1 Tax=Mucilaginibacter pankratovii TaxID=2772110 RepID=A0ABR7WSW3_9SPHI|nr:hypothetical protein [Mucilaginibacter pankratovii]MBD1365393.1 hypothetical protein [Mucilaginibacter pankratovii]
MKHLDESISLLKEKPANLLDRTVGLTKALLLKLNFAITKDERISGAICHKRKRLW